MKLRLASRDDLAAITAIYNHEVMHSVATFDTEPRSATAADAWFDDHPADGWPLIVAVDPGADPDIIPDGVLGWAALNRYSTRCAYRRAAEISVYVHREARGRGAGRALLARLCELAPTCGVHTLLARIEASGEASLRLHRAVGFTTVGTLHQVGEKFGRLLDVVMMERVR